MDKLLITKRERIDYVFECLNYLSIQDWEDYFLENINNKQFKNQQKNLEQQKLSDIKRYIDNVDFYFRQYILFKNSFKDYSTLSADKEYYTIAEVSKLFNTTRPTLNRWHKQGKLVKHIIRDGRTVRYYVNDLKEFLIKHPTELNSKSKDLSI